MAKQKNNKKKFMPGKFFDFGHHLPTNTILTALSKKNPIPTHDIDTKRYRKAIRLLGAQFLQEFDATINLEFNDFAKYWFDDDTPFATRLVKAIKQRYEYETNAKTSDIVTMVLINAHARQVIESAYVMYHQRRIEANAHFVEDLDISNWDYTNLDALSDSAVDFLNDDGTYVGIYADLVKMEGCYIDEEGEKLDIYTLTLSTGEALRLQVRVSPSLPGMFILDDVGFNIHTFTTESGLTMKHTVAKVSDCGIDDILLKYLYSVIECSHQYATTIVRKRKRSNSKYEATEHTTSSSTAARSLIKYIYVDDEAYTMEEVRKGVKHKSPRCHERAGAWCVSKKGKRFWRSPTIVNKGKGTITYKMAAPPRKENNNVAET